MHSFKEFVNAGAFLNTAYNSFDNQFFGVGKSLELPTPTLELPTNIIDGKIRRILYTKNPINIVFDNGSSWKVTKEQWDYLLSVGKEPKIGSRMQVEVYYDGTVKSVNVL